MSFNNIVSCCSFSSKDLKSPYKFKMLFAFAVTQLYSDMFDLLCIMIYNDINFFMTPKQTQ